MEGLFLKDRAHRAKLYIARLCLFDFCIFCPVKFLYRFYALYFFIVTSSTMSHCVPS